MFCTAIHRIIETKLAFLAKDRKKDNKGSNRSFIYGTTKWEIIEIKPGVFKPKKMDYLEILDNAHLDMIDFIIQNSKYSPNYVRGEISFWEFFKIMRKIQKRIEREIQNSKNGGQQHIPRNNGS